VKRTALTAERLAPELKRLLAQAARGPWKSVRNTQRPYKHVQFGRDEMYTTSPLEAGDADLIAWMRNHAEDIIVALENAAPACPSPRGEATPADS